jgi:hypothetical protein
MQAGEIEKTLDFRVPDREYDLLLTSSTVENAYGLLDDMSIWFIGYNNILAYRYGHVNDKVSYIKIDEHHNLWFLHKTDYDNNKEYLGPNSYGDETLLCWEQTIIDFYLNKVDDKLNEIIFNS